MHDPPARWVGRGTKKEHGSERSWGDSGGGGGGIITGIDLVHEGLDFFLQGGCGSVFPITAGEGAETGEEFAEGLGIGGRAGGATTHFEEVIGADGTRIHAGDDEVIPERVREGETGTIDAKAIAGAGLGAVRREVPIRGEVKGGRKGVVEREKKDLGERMGSAIEIDIGSEDVAQFFGEGEARELGD